MFKNINTYFCIVLNLYHVGKLNPFRYRGYYLDTETGFYYLMSRYYDPVTHRFVNSDGYFQAGSDILDTNMNAYCRNNPINFYDPTGKHSTSIKCGDPTCTTCRQSRRDFINSHVDWYNRVTNSNIAGVSYDGTFYYEEKLNIDFNSTESKVLGTVGAFLFSFEANADAGFGFGVSTDIFKIVGIEVFSKVAFRIELSGHDGFDFGVYQGSSGGISVWDVDVANIEFSTLDSLITGERHVNVGVSNVVGVSKGVYVMIGASGNIGFDVNYFIKRITEIW